MLNLSNPISRTFQSSLVAQCSCVKSLNGKNNNLPTYQEHETILLRKKQWQSNRTLHNPRSTSIFFLQYLSMCRQHCVCFVRRFLTAYLYALTLFIGWIGFKNRRSSLLYACFCHVSFLALTVHHTQY